MHARRHARDYERLVQHAGSLIAWAAITLMTRRPTRKRPAEGHDRPGRDGGRRLTGGRDRLRRGFRRHPSIELGLRLDA